MRATSGTYNALSFPLAELFLEAFATGCEIFGPQIMQLHMQEARRSANILLQGKWGNRGPNLGQVGDEQLCIPLQPGVASYVCPAETISILDAYLRTYTPSGIYSTVGRVLTPLGPPSSPLVTQWGAPVVMSPGSTVFSTTAGIQECRMYYPAHGLIPGAPLFWECPVTVGGFTLYTFSIVDQVIDGNYLTFLLPAPALETQNGQGGTPLFYTNVGSTIVNVISPSHQLEIGSVFNVPIPTLVGGFRLSGLYTVTSVLAPTSPNLPYSYQYSFIPTGDNATSTDMGFENGGQISVATQQAGLLWTDIYLYPLSRNDYAMLPVKESPGGPTQYWFNRTIVPQIVVWPIVGLVEPVVSTPEPGAPIVCPQQLTSDEGIPLTSDAGQPLGGLNTTGQPLTELEITAPPAVTIDRQRYLGFVAYRMRAYQDVNPVMGQTLDAPARFYEAFCMELGARMALKFKPDKFVLMETLAKQAWDEAASEDRERVSTYIVPDFSGYFSA